MNQKSSTKSLSFPQAIAATQSLIQQISNNQLSEAQIKQEITCLLINKNGGRGFFVAYLTSNLPHADKASLGIIEGLEASIEVAAELLVMNLAMSSAMIINHSRNQDFDNVEGSRKVHRRTHNLIKQLNQLTIQKELHKLLQTIDNQSGKYQDFLNRWNYDHEQKTAIKKAVIAILN